jgi:hypothetical protein
VGVIMNTAGLAHCGGLCGNKFWAVPMLNPEVTVQVE